MMNMLERVNTMKVENTKEVFTGYIYGLECYGVVYDKKISGLEKNIGQISREVTRLIAALKNPELMRKCLESLELTPGKNKYIGLTQTDDNKIKEFNNTRSVVPFRIQLIEKGIMKRCQEEFEDCEWSDENLYKFGLDMIKFGRVSQEGTIDYPKTGILPEVFNFYCKNLELMSLQKMEVVFKDGEVKIDIIEKIKKDAVIYNDPAHISRVELAEESKHLIEKGIVPMIVSPESDSPFKRAIDSMKFNSILPALRDAKFAYGDFARSYYQLMEDTVDEETESSSYEEIKKDFNEALENIIRLATGNLKPYQLGVAMMASNELTIGRNSTVQNSSFAYSMCKQEHLMALSHYNKLELNFVGDKVLKCADYIKEYKPSVYLTNGKNKDVITNGSYTGWAQIKEHNENLYAAVNIEEVVKIPASTNKVLIKLKQGENANNTEEMINILSNADRIMLRNAPHFDVVAKTGDKYYNFKHAFDVNLTKAFAGKPGNISRVICCEGEKYTSVYLIVELDEIPTPIMDVDFNEEIIVPLNTRVVKLGKNGIIKDKIEDTPTKERIESKIISSGVKVEESDEI